MERPPYQPLRIAAGWRVDWNTLFEIEPSEDSVAAGYFGGSSLFAASHEHMRLAVDVEWRPEDDPAGEYVLSVMYVPWERTESGRRRKGAIDWRNAQLVHTYRTRSRAGIINELETAFLGRPEWIEHN